MSSFKKWSAFAAALALGAFATTAQADRPPTSPTMPTVTVTMVDECYDNCMLICWKMGGSQMACHISCMGALCLREIPSVELRQTAFKERGPTLVHD